ncbi:MAG TPA: hypothetical protein VH164_14245 [Ktedonobacteraceae bacterium]|nr:hypothetical protein [Ktedonobacteraceae bacterium]
MSKGSSMYQVNSHEFACGGRVGNDALSASFCNLGSDAHHAMSWIEIVASHRAHFFASQSGIVGQGRHTARSQRSLLNHSQKGPPLLIARDPRHGLEARDQRPFTIRSKCLARRVSSTTNGVICSLPFLDEEIKKQANGCQSLLKRRIRQTS